MATTPTSPEARAAQALNDVETALRNMNASNQAIASSVDSAVVSMDTATDAIKSVANSMEAATDALKTVRASAAAVAASIDAAANVLVRVAVAFEEIREDRLRDSD